MLAQKTAYEIGVRLVGSEMCIRDRQNDKRLPMLISTSRDDCPGIRMSVQFDIQSVPLTLQFGGAMVRRLNISVLRVREKYGIDSWRP